MYESTSQASPRFGRTSGRCDRVGLCPSGLSARISSAGPARFDRLFLGDLEAYQRRAGVLHAQPFCGCLRQIYDAAADIRAAVVDLDLDSLAIVEIDHRRLGAERQLSMRG